MEFGKISHVKLWAVVIRCLTSCLDIHTSLLTFAGMSKSSTGFADNKSRIQTSKNCSQGTFVAGVLPWWQIASFARSW